MHDVCFLDSSCGWAVGDSGIILRTENAGVAWKRQVSVLNIRALPLETMKAYQLAHFESELITDLAWSKDGKSLAVVRGGLSGDIVLLTNAQ